MLSSWLRGINGNERKWGRDAARPKAHCRSTALCMTNDALRIRHRLLQLFRYSPGRTPQREAITSAGESGGAEADTAAKSKRSHIRARVRDPGVQADANSASAVHDVHYSEIRAGALRSPRDRAPAQGTTGRSLTFVTLPSGPVQSTWRPAPSSRTTRSEIQ